MTQLTANYSTTIAASAETVYGILADYAGAHRKILPPDTFLALNVTKGGHGAGTELDVRTRILGKEQMLHMIVSAPEPGRTLMETDITTGLATTFTVTATSESTCNVAIKTVWESQKGFTGLLEGLLVPGALRRIYRKQLEMMQEMVASV